MVFHLMKYDWKGAERRYEATRRKSDILSAFSFLLKAIYYSCTITKRPQFIVSTHHEENIHLIDGSTYHNVPSTSNTMPLNLGASDFSAFCGLSGANRCGRLRNDCSIEDMYLCLKLDNCSKEGKGRWQARHIILLKP